MTKDEGGVELDLSDDPFDFKRLNVAGAPVIVTVNKVSFTYNAIHNSYLSPQIRNFFFLLISKPLILRCVFFSILFFFRNE